MKSPGFRECRRVTLSVDALQYRQDPAEESDPAVERLVSRGPDMIMSPTEEEAGRARALNDAVDRAAAACLSGESVDTLRSVLDRRWNAFRRALRGNPLANVERLKVTMKPGAAAVKARPRLYNPSKMAWLSTCLATLVAMGLIVRNKQAVFG